MHSSITTIVETFRARGDGAYGAEAVNQRQHALQSATLASAEGADEHLVAAADDGRGERQHRAEMTGEAARRKENAQWRFPQ